MNNEDKEIEAVTSDLLVDKYMITVEDYRNALTSKSTMLVMYVPKAVMTYQSRRLDEMLNDSSARLETAGDDIQLQMDMLKRIDMLNRLKTAINNKLGRV